MNTCDGRASDGDVAEPALVAPLLEQHEANTGAEVATAVADRGYGTVGAYCALVDQGVRPHMPPMQPAGHKSNGLFTKEDFRYDEKADVYVCPVGHRLQPKRVHQRREMVDYVADKNVCAKCALRAECTRSKAGRSIARHWEEAKLEIALAFARLPEAQQDRRRRRHLMEGSFAQAANKHHFKRARWRRLWRQQIQDWLIAAVQNIALLCGSNGLGVAAKRPNTPKTRAATPVSFVLRVNHVLCAINRPPPCLSAVAPLAVAA